MICEFYAKRYCRDDISKIENYADAVADKTQTWDCHHRWELTLDGEFAHSAEELIAMDMYYNRPYFELIFIPHGEHVRMHHSGRHCSEETKKKISAIQKITHNRPDVRAKMSAAAKISQNRPEVKAKMGAIQKIAKQALSKLYHEAQANSYKGTWKQFLHDHSIGLV